MKALLLITISLLINLSYAQDKAAAEPVKKIEVDLAKMVGKSKQKIYKYLGKPYLENKDNSASWTYEKWDITINFKNNELEKVSIMLDKLNDETSYKTLTDLASAFGFTEKRGYKLGKPSKKRIFIKFYVTSKKGDVYTIITEKNNESYSSLKFRPYAE